MKSHMRRNCTSNLPRIKKKSNFPFALSLLLLLLQLFSVSSTTQLIPRISANCICEAFVFPLILLLLPFSFECGNQSASRASRLASCRRTDRQAGRQTRGRMRVRLSGTPSSSGHTPPLFPITNYLLSIPILHYAQITHQHRLSSNLRESKE